MGKFIAIYGVNNVGKTTHTKLLKERLEKEGNKVISLKYPIYESPTGQRINSILREGAEPDISPGHFQMIYCLNRFDFEKDLKKLLNEYDYVLAEDYSFTSVSWGTAFGADTEWLIQINSKLLQPDLTILLDGERSLETIEKGHKHENHQEAADIVSQVLRDMQQRFNWQHVIRQEHIEDTHEMMYNALIENI